MTLSFSMRCRISNTEPDDGHTIVVEVCRDNCEYVSIQHRNKADFLIEDFVVHENSIPDLIESLRKFQP